MAKEKFKWKTQWGMTGETEPKVKKIEFGNGYEQRMPNGLNHISTTRNIIVRIDKKYRTLIDELEDFLVRHGGYQSFEWTPPGKSEAILVVCEKWATTDTGPYIDFELPFRQVFN